MSLEPILKDNRFCQCTTKNPSECSICKKPMLYIDTPYGAMPTLDFMNYFYDIYNVQIQKIATDYFNSLFTYFQKEFENKILGYQEKIGPLITQLNELKINMSENYQDSLANMEQKATDIKDRTSQFITSLSTTVDSKITTIDDKMALLQNFTNQLFVNVNKLIQVNQEVNQFLFSTATDYEEIRIKMQQTVQPNIESILSSLKIVEKILPSIQPELNIIEDISVYTQNKSYVNPYELEKYMANH